MEDIDKEEEKEEEEEEILGNNNDNDDAQYGDGIDSDDRKNNKNAVESKTPRNNAKKNYCKIKRKMLQRNLSASQRDQAYLNMTRDELQLKQNLVYQLTEATHETNKAFRQISESVVSVGNSIGNGLKLLARALRGSQQNNNLSYYDQPFLTVSNRYSKTH